MIFPDPATLFILAALKNCPAQPAPEVVLKFINKSPTYDSRMTAAELGNFDIDTQFARHRNEVFTTGGITEGTVGTSLETTFKKLTDAQEIDACIWLDKVEITVTYVPMVHIARELTPGSCQYNTTVQHENRHVGTDVITVKEFLPQIKGNLEAASRAIGVIALPVKDIGQAKEQLMRILAQSLEKTTNSLEAVRFQRQQLIDTRQEYMRLSKACPN
jgi:hypothetical protein